MEQFNANYINNTILKENYPADAIAAMAFTAKDLYPSEDWNYVFGLSSYKLHAGVSSLKRFGFENMDSIQFHTCLSRIMKVASHEIGHMFWMYHCINAKCVMNGTNSVNETDRLPTRLCSECHRKLYWNIGFDIKKRLKELSNFYEQNNFQNEANLCKKDYETIIN